jgi:hypothetical protein
VRILIRNNLRAAWLGLLLVGLKVIVYKWLTWGLPR